MTRRRNRLNGTVRRDDARGFGVTVGQSFGNCPQYIQKREFVVTRDPATPGTVAPQILTALDARARTLIRHADSFFVATYVDLPGTPGGCLPSWRPTRIRARGCRWRPDDSGLRRQYVLQYAWQHAGESGGGTGVRQLSDRRPAADDGPRRGHHRFARDPHCRGCGAAVALFPRQIVRRDRALPLRWDFMPGGESPQALRTGVWPGDPAS
jgi:predicted pyridoxine 5'-phosphate oxidase superfamily flavin-nucleotide-binding protein